MTEVAADVEKAISACVKLFYEKAGADPLLGPIFAASIPDLEGHLEIVINFWSRVLLGTTRYNGHPYPPHVPLAIEPEHFERWLKLFEETCCETLPPATCAEAIAKARHMSASFLAGMFPFRSPDGRPSRTPA
jgi:hemoglobin